MMAEFLYRMCFIPFFYFLIIISYVTKHWLDDWMNEFTWCRPLWVGPNGHIFLEAFSPVYKVTLPTSNPLLRMVRFYFHNLSNFTMFFFIKVWFSESESIKKNNGFSDPNPFKISTDPHP